MRNGLPLSRLLFGLVALLLTSASLQAQLSFGGRPWGWHAEKQGWERPPVFTRPALDRDVLLAEDDQRAAATGNKRLRFGVNHATDLGTDNSGVWNTLPNGDRVWRLDIDLEGAFSVNFEFSEFVVPEGGRVYAYTPSGEQLGGFTAASNPGHTELGVGLLPGSRITVEYDEPAAVAGQGHLRIGQVTQGYRDSFAMMKGFNESLSCNNNVICPEGDSWRDQIRSVARIVVNGGDWCTGQLINDCASDGTPYFLTANHCLGGNVGTWVFAFNWESSQCATNVNTPMDQTMSGAQLLENSAGSDVALLRLNTTPPAEYGVYYTGWDASGTPPLDEIGIHHPSGDQKKISFNGETSTEVTFGNAGCWRVDAWDDGTTEGGSSGSGLWDQNGHLVGQLYGGTFGCNCTDNYGRFSLSYPLLQDHLGTCGPVLEGYDPNTTALPVDGAVQAVNSIPPVVCNATSISPEVVVRNAGLDPLTSLTLNWEVTGGASGQENWTGSLASGATATVTIPDVTVSDGAHTFTVTASLPNGTADPNGANDSRSVDFTVASSGIEATLSITFDDYGSETSWEVTAQGSGAPLYTGGPYSDDTGGQVQAIGLCLPAGCYTLTVFDEYGDGICCEYGNGSYVLTSGGVPLVNGDGQFEDETASDFCLISTGVGTLDSPIMAVRPNPGTGRFELLAPSSGASVTVEVWDATGRRIIEEQRGPVQGALTLDLTGRTEGIYTVKVRSAGRVSTGRLVLVH